MSTIVRIAAVSLLAAASLSSQPQPVNRLETNKLEANKAALFEFFRLGANVGARMNMLADDYVQHNPRFLKMDEATHRSGKEAWGAAQAAARGHANLTDLRFDLRSQPVAVVAEGDYVAAFYKTTLPDPDKPGSTYEAFNFELVRFRDGKLAEHWDAVQLEKGWRTELEKPAPAR